jgi:hypothetical protein
MTTIAIPTSTLSDATLRLLYREIKKVHSSFTKEGLDTYAAECATAMDSINAELQKRAK